MLSGASGTLVPYQLLRFLLLGDINSGGLVAKSCLTLVTPWTVALQAPLSKGFSRQVGCHFLLWEIFWTQELNLGLLHCRWILDQLTYEGNP